MTRCECVQCCDGEHPGCCKECAGWGDRLDGPGLDMRCVYCDGTGVCPKCDGHATASVHPCPKPGHRHRRAFTLVELLVTISVVALLLGIALPVLAGVRDTARRVHCQASQRTLAQGLAVYRLSVADALPYAASPADLRVVQTAPYDVLAGVLGVPLPVLGPDGFATRMDPWSCPGDELATEATGFGQVYAPAALFGALPADQAGVVRRLWDQDPRAVLFLCAEPAHPGRGHARRNAARADASVGPYRGVLFSVR